MEVILCENVDKLGKTGQVVKVKEGFARNFLFPRKLALLANDANVKIANQRKAKQQAIEEEQKKSAQVLAEKLAKVSCTVTAEVNDREKLYGTVTAIDVVKALKEEGFEFDKKDIVIETPIEEVGIFEVGVRVHPEIVAKVRIWVAKK